MWPCQGGWNSSGIYFNPIILCCQELPGSLPLVCKLSHSQVSFHLGVPSCQHLEPSSGLRQDAQPLSYKNIDSNFDATPGLLLRPHSSVLRIHILGMWIGDFCSWVHLGLCISFLLPATLSQSSNCQYPASVYTRTVSLPGCLFRPLKRILSFLHWLPPWESCHFTILSFCLRYIPGPQDFTSSSGPIVAGRTNLYKFTS